MNNLESCDIITKNLIIKAIDNISRVKGNSHPITNKELQDEVNKIENTI